jgi:hypothetical protein
MTSTLLCMGSTRSSPFRRITTVMLGTCTLAPWARSGWMIVWRCATASRSDVVAGTHVIDSIVSLALYLHEVGILVSDLPTAAAEASKVKDTSPGSLSCLATHKVTQSSGHLKLTLIGIPLMAYRSCMVAVCHQLSNARAPVAHTSVCLHCLSFSRVRHWNACVSLCLPLRLQKAGLCLNRCFSDALQRRSGHGRIGDTGECQLLTRLDLLSATPW